MSRALKLATIAALMALLGSCSSSPAAPGSCKSERDCDIGEFCMRPVGECEAPGRCTQRPQMCTQDYTPVCGCDGITHSNRCGAHAAGTSIATTAACGERP